VEVKSGPFIMSPWRIVARQETAALLTAWGFLTPVARGQEERLRIDVEKVEGWVAKGAQLSPRVRKLMKEYQAGAEAAAA
jgi:small subunit ribosomal protein S16